MPKPRFRVDPKDGVKYWGFDPGKQGGIAILDQYRVHTYAMPETERDVWDVINAHRAGHNRVIIEKVASSPQMGVTSAFTFGRGYGTLLGMLTAAGLPHEEIRPQVWQKALHIPPRKPHNKKREREITKGKNKGKMVEEGYGGETDTVFKTRLRDKAQKMFPDLDLWGNTKTIQMAICDALLIAEYAKRSAR